jgi:hypothetical protein
MGLNIELLLPDDTRLFYFLRLLLPLNKPIKQNKNTRRSQRDDYRQHNKRMALSLSLNELKLFMSLSLYM